VEIQRSSFANACNFPLMIFKIDNLSRICCCKCDKITWKATPENEARIAISIAKNKRKREKEVENSKKFNNIEDPVSRKILCDVDESVLKCLPHEARKNLGLNAKERQEESSKMDSLSNQNVSCIIPDFLNFLGINFKNLNQSKILHCFNVNSYVHLR